MHASPLKSLLAIALVAVAGTTAAQTKLKFAHVYETSEAYHTAALWAAEEIKKRTAGRYEISVFPASQLGKETDINQGLTLGTVDIIYTGQAFAARTLPALAIGGAPFMFRDEDRKFKHHFLAHDRPGKAPDSAGCCLLEVFWSWLGPAGVGLDLQSVDGAPKTRLSQGFPTGEP